MRITVVGSASPFPRPKNPCSCFLLEHGTRKILLECGSGSLLQLVQLTSLDAITDVIISHFHGDHMSDLLVLKYAVDLGLNVGRRQRPLSVYCPSQPVDMVDLVRYKQSLIPVAFDPGQSIDLDELTVTAHPTEHPLFGVSIRFDWNGGSLFYTGDTGPLSSLITGALDTDVLLAEATYAQSSGIIIDGHMSGVQAGELARAANSKHLIITHVSGFSDEHKVLAEAQSSFPGPTTLAQPSLTIDV